MVNLFKTISYLKISTLSLRANRLRSFLSIIGVVFGVMAVIVIIAVGEGAKAEALRQIERLGTKNIYVKSNQAGDFTIVNPYLIEDLKKLDLWDSEMLGKIKYHDGRISDINEIPQNLKDKYKEVFEISPKWMTKAIAYRGKWIDQSQSYNVFYNGRSGKDINDIYMYAWEMGLKTTYYLRTLGASQVEKSTVSAEEHGSTHQRQSFQEKQTPQAKPPSALPIVEPSSQNQPSTVKPEPQPSCRIDDPECESCSG